MAWRVQPREVRAAACSLACELSSPPAGRGCSVLGRPEGPLPAAESLAGASQANTHRAELPPARPRPSSGTARCGARMDQARPLEGTGTASQGEWNGQVRRSNFLDPWGQSRGVLELSDPGGPKGGGMGRWVTAGVWLPSHGPERKVKPGRARQTRGWGSCEWRREGWGGS